MTQTLRSFPPGTLVHDDEDLLALARFVVQDDPVPDWCLNLAWLDADDRTTELMLAIHEVPELPDPETAERFGTIVGTVMDDHAPGGSIVAILERPGGGAITRSDRAWNAVLREQGARLGFRVRGVFVGAARRVRPLALDDALEVV